MKVIVIGAGIAGLGAGIYFALKGHDVTVLEAEDKVGGRARTLVRKGSPDLVDAGTQYYHSSYKRALGLIDAAGLGESIYRISGYTRIHDDSVSGGSFLLHHRYPWYKSAGVTGNIRLGLFLLRSLLTFHRNYFAADSSPEADNQAGVALMDNPLVWDSIIRPLCLAGALAEPGETNLSIHHINRLIRVILLTDYISLTGSTQSLPMALARKLDVRPGTPVARILVDGKRPAAVELAGSGQALKADHIVIATTPGPAAGLIPEDWQEERQYLQAITIPAFILPTFYLDRPLEKNVWSHLTHNRSGLIQFITDAARKNPRMVPSGNSIIQPWICYPGSAQLLDMTEDQMLNLCLDELDALFPGFTDWVTDIAVTRHPYAVPFTPVGHNARTLEFLANADRRGISFCGDYLSGGYMESALWSAQRAAEKFGG